MMVEIRLDGPLKAIMEATYPDPLPWPTLPCTSEQLVAAVGSRRFGAAGPMSGWRVFREAFRGGDFDPRCDWAWRHGVTVERYGRFFRLAGEIKLGLFVAAWLAAVGAVVIGGLMLGGD